MIAPFDISAVRYALVVASKPIMYRNLASLLDVSAFFDHLQGCISTKKNTTLADHGIDVQL